MNHSLRSQIYYAILAVEIVVLATVFSLILADSIDYVLQGNH